jgi:hypothetical protein
MFLPGVCIRGGESRQAAGKSKPKGITCKQNKIIGGIEMRLFVIVVTAQAQGPALSSVHTGKRPK